MDVGELRHRVTIRRQADVSDGKGGFDRGWTTLALRIPARVKNMNGREALIGGVLTGVSTFEVVTRYRTDIQTADQLVWDTRELNVHSAEDKAGTRQWTTIIASTEAPQGA
jgi:SPP1 family predicted phage head-tail adaptor